MDRSLSSSVRSSKSGSPPKWRTHDQLAQKHGKRKTVISAAGDRYTGEWANNRREGMGHQVWVKQGKEYNGMWKDHQRHGQGALVVNGNVVYEGQWHKDKMHGNGKYLYPNYDLYDGEWENNQRTGAGTMNYADGSIYTGGWVKGKRSGRGVLLLPNGNKFDGHWENDEKHGPGVYHYVKQNQRYDGEWVNGSAKCGVFVDVPPVEIADEDHKEEQPPAVSPYAPETSLKIPQLGLAHPDLVLKEQTALFRQGSPQTTTGVDEEIEYLHEELETDFEGDFGDESEDLPVL